MEIEKIYELFLQCNFTVCTDTRKIAANGLFICLKGANFNGNEFASKAIEQGAKYALCDEEKYQTENVFLVENCLNTLQQLAAYHRKQMPAKIVGIGGSNGKTTTKELCFEVCKKQFETIATKGNLNNHIGVPLTLLGIKPTTEIAIIEMGTNHPGEMNVLCNMVNPDIAIVTNIGLEHLEGFGTMDAIVKEETELFANIIEHNGFALVNNDDKYLAQSGKRIPNRKSYGIDNAADLTFIVEAEMPQLRFSLNGTSNKAQIGGKYNAYNIAAAIALGNQLGIPMPASVEACCNYKPDNNRSQWIEIDSIKILLDSYNANPSSVENVLYAFAKLDGNNAVILGDMFELGESALSEHQRMIDLCSELKLKHCFFIGNQYAACDANNFYCYEDLNSFYQNQLENLLQFKHLLIKASRGMELEKIVGQLQGKD